jgi:pilus assembly protein CpaB
MNVTRIAILGVALIAAIVAAMLVRSMLGGGTAASQASVQAILQTTDVLVAAKDIVPGHTLEADSVHWEAWPKKSVATGFITKDTQSDISKAIEGMVVRAPLVTGQPISDANVVRAGTSGFLAATIKPGMRGVGLIISAQTGAGGFILPNDHVDVVVTRDISDGNGPKIFRVFTIVRDVRVLAVDQTAKLEKDEQSIVAKTATIELTQSQAELVALAQQVGVVSLTLRALGDSTGEPSTESPAKPAPDAEKPLVRAVPQQTASAEHKSPVTVYRYGIVRDEKAANAGGASGPVVMTAPAQPNISVPSETANPVQPGTPLSDPSALPTAMAAP